MPEQYREPFWQHSTDMLGVANSSGVWISISPSWSRILGWKLDEIVGRTSEWMEHPEDREKTRAEVFQLAAGKTTLLFENRFRTMDGSYRTLSWRAVSDDGLLYCVARDVTDQRAAAQSALEETKARERAWIHNPDLLSVINMENGTFERVNPAWAMALGWAHFEVEGRPYTDFVHPDDIGASDAAFERVRLGDPVLRFENRYRTKAGDWRWLSWVALPEGSKLYSSTRDVTLEREARDEFVALESQLRQSQKMEAVGQLTGGLAHDFNNLLAGISGSLELMQRRIQQGRLSDIERYMSAAQGATKRAAALTHRLLAFSRRQTLDPKPTNVNQLVTGLQELVQRTVGPGVALEIKEAADLWTALIDPSQLENALLNLCINARDAMPDGGRITIATANRTLDAKGAAHYDVPEGQYLALSVTDTGTGMSPEMITRVFEPFFTTKPIGEGTGLGLSMIYGFAKQSDGQVRIHSTVGEGTTVTIYMPRHLGDAEVEDALQPTAKLSRSTDGETVLVVDDEPTVRMLIVEILDELGYTAIEASDSAAGLRVLKSDVPLDLLITDVGLPGGMNGRQMADAARMNRPNLKVLFVTGYAESLALDGIDKFSRDMQLITKPFAVDAMAARIRLMIETAVVSDA